MNKIVLYCNDGSKKRQLHFCFIHGDAHTLFKAVYPNGNFLDFLPAWFEEDFGDKVNFSNYEEARAARKRIIEHINKLYPFWTSSNVFDRYGFVRVWTENHIIKEYNK